MQDMTSGRTRLSHLGVLRAQGPDAAAFVHGQLTQDFALLQANQARLAGYCSAKGRLLASFIGLRPDPQTVLLVCSADVLPATLQRLKMFVMRAQVVLSDDSAQWQIWGVAGPQVPNEAAAASSPWDCMPQGDGWRISLYPAQNLQRALWLAPGASAPPPGPELDPAVWSWLEVQSGIAWVTQPLVDALVPQMLNYESVGGVSFKKGCYPGQEVVARSQFRGTLKRRTFLAHLQAPAQTGQPVVDPLDPDQDAGLVVAAAPCPSGGWDALVAVQTSAVERSLRLGAADGPTLQLSPVPYPLLADV